jgi:GH24 family phage-related lysozyme (muramidase)
MIRIIISIVFIALFIVSGSIDCNAFRCGDGFVSVGDSKAKVQLECGKPTSKGKARVKKGRHYRSVEREKESSDTKRVYLAKEKKKPVEKWYYNCGENDFIYVLTFEGGTLKSEETGGYGKGKSDCKGR